MKNNSIKTAVVAIAATLLLTACGNDLSGNVYQQAEGSLDFKLTFQDDGYVEMGGTMMPDTLMAYKVEDDKVLVGPEGAQQVWKILDNGNLKTPMGELRKIDKQIVSQGVW